MARDRSLKLIIQAQVDGAKRALRETAAEAKKVGDESEKASKRATTASERMVHSARDNQQAWNTAGTILTGFGVASGAALAGSAAAAIDWQSSWAGVTKTVGEAEAASVGLNDGLRQMARELPASHSEIAAVAEAAGQLGIQAPNIEGFTRTMIDLGEASNLTADEAATALARFSNIMGTSQDEFSNLGSAIVELGNNYATTEREIVEMSTRLAGAGRQAGLTEGEVLGLATALSSVGIEAEAGGTAFSRVLIEMGTAVDTQSESLDTFARVAGMSAEQFSTAWGENPGSAISAFIAGMGRMDASGQSVQPVLEELGMTDIRVGDALRRSASAADLFTGAMETGNTAFAANTALAEEAAQRYATVESRLSMAKNSIRDAGISLGEVFLPAIGAAADGAANFAGWLADLPGPLQGLAAGVGSAAASAGLMGGAFFLMTPRLIESYDAFRDLAGISPRLNDALGKVGKTVAAGGTLVAGLAIIGGALGAIQRATSEAVPELEHFTGALLDMQAAESLQSVDQILADMDVRMLGVHKWRGPIDDFSEAVDVMLDPSFVQRAENLDKALSFGQIQTTQDRIAPFFEMLDNSVASMVNSGNIDLAAQQFEMLWASLAGDHSREEFLALFPQYEAALQGIDNNARVAAEGAGALGTMLTGAAEQIRAHSEEADEATEALAEYRAELAGISASFIDSNGAYSVAMEAAQTWAQGQADATDSAEDSWSDYIGKFTGTTEAYLGELRRMAEAQNNWEANLFGLIARGVPMEFVSHLAEMGPAAADEVALVADMTDAELAEWVSLMGQRGGEGLDAFSTGLTDPATQAVLRVAGTQLGAEALAGLVQELSTGAITAQEAIDKYDLKVNIGAETGAAEGAHLGLMEDINTSEGTVTIDGEDGLAQGVRLGLVSDIDTSSGTVTMNADDALAQGARLGLVASIDTSSGTVTMFGDPGPADAARSGAVVRINLSSGTLTIDGNNGWAIEAGRAAVRSINSMSATINVTARYAGGLNMGGSARTMVSARASGGVDGTGRYYERRPMVGGSAYGIRDLMWPSLDGSHLVKSMDVKREAYISDNPAYRDENIRYLRTAASWFGLDVKAYAAGGIAAQRWRPAAPVAGPTVVSIDGARITGRLEIGGDGLATLVDGRIEADHDHARYDSRMVGL